jgi:hypothetical protein
MSRLDLLISVAVLGDSLLKSVRFPAPEIVLKTGVLGAVRDLLQTCPANNF